MTGRSGIAAVLLAAGQSRRMGQRNKLLLDIDGEPMVRRSAATVLASRAAKVVAVVGHQSTAVGEALAGLPIQLVYNPAYREGQMISVRRGLAALPDIYAGILVCLADQPALTPADIDFMIDAFHRFGRHGIAVPVRDGRRGNPIVLAARHRAELDGRRLNFGCRNLIERNPDAVCAVRAPNERFFADVDTPDDFAGLDQKSARS